MNRNQSFKIVINIFLVCNLFSCNQKSFDYPPTTEILYYHDFKNGNGGWQSPLKNVHLNEIKDRNLNLPIKIKLKKPKQVGSDRVVNAIAAFKIYKKNSIIIDFGTATTFDVIVQNSYIGGMITPGINLSLKVLKEATAKLPLIKLKKTNKYIGKDTVSAMNNGMYWGYIGLIKELVQKIIKETKKKYLVIFTGGLANIFFSSFPFKDKVIDQQITLKGIAETLKFNLKNI